MNICVLFLSSLTEDGYELFRVAEKSHGSWMKLYMDGNTSEVLGNMGKKVLKQYLEALKAMSSALSKQLGKYDMYSMIMGMILVLQVRNMFTENTLFHLTKTFLPFSMLHQLHVQSVNMSADKHIYY